MKQQLWILDSSLLAIFLVVLFVSQMLKQEPPVFRQKRIIAIQEAVEKKKSAKSKLNWDIIYKSDLFGTFIHKETVPVKKELVAPIPAPKPADTALPPEPKKQEFVEPLKITVKGIIVSADEDRSVAMVEDEAKKEKLYHLGEKIKDGQIIKVERNRLVVLRGNGQQEVFFLRKDDAKLQEDTPDKWKYIIKKGEDEVYELDPQHFVEEVESLGSFIERASIIGTAYSGGKPVGIRIGELEKDNVGQMLNLKKGDIITSINDISPIDVKDRLKIYDAVTNAKIGDNIKVVVKRDGNDETLTYRFAKISKAKKKTFAPDKKEGDKEAVQLKLSKLQEREKQIRDFKVTHGTSDSKQREAISKIRKRLLENLRSRMKNSRVR